jgi:excisionase family DNA binding protein
MITRQKKVLPAGFEPSPALTVLEAAAFLRCGRNQVFQLISERRLPVARVGRAFLVPRRACETLLEQQWAACGRGKVVEK